MIKRILYLGYYFKELDWTILKVFFDYVKKEKSKTQLWIDIIKSSLRYNISILDYFYFKFYKLTHKERSTYAGTGFMYEYQLKMNPKEHRDILENKILFLNEYKGFVIREFASIGELENNPNKLKSILNNSSGKIVLKGSKGQVGKEVKILKSDDIEPDRLMKFMKDNNFDLLEEYVVQHPVIMNLSPSGLNTIRIFTQIIGNKIYYLGARLRITINSEVDNMAAGNAAAPIDMETGIVNGSAVFSDITKVDIKIHPITNVPIIGLQIPFWDEIKEMVEKAALNHPKNRSIGWDVAITEKGPELIEGNHNWCKILWQLPVKKGLKKEIEKFI